ncbi:MAG: hypothetical protein EBS55_07485 [Flavobacteriaceae bacterium]|nr:hypothetical protein [Flavobacteriaceae bacterium]
MSFIKSVLKFNSDYYAEQIWPSTLENINEALSKDTLRVRQIVFNKKELSFVKSEIGNANSKKWCSRKLENAKCLPWAEVNTIYKTNPFFLLPSFSKPVFVRNNKYCFFYSDDGGAGNFSIFEKQEDKSWKEIKKIFWWIS